MSLQSVFDGFAFITDVPNAVVKIRELVLQLAVQGRLAESSPADPALLDQVISEKRNALSRLRIRRHPEQSDIERGDFPYSFPESWCAVTLGDLVYNCATSYGEDPRPDLVTKGVVKVGNIDNQGYFKGTFAERGFPRDEIDDLIARAGDLMVVKSSGSAENVHSGKTALCREEHDGKIVGTNFVMRLRRLGSLIDPEYLWRVLCSRHSRAWVERTVQTMTYPNLKWSDFSRLPVPLPSLEEQKRIVAKVDELMLLSDELKARQQARHESRARLNTATLAPLNNAASLPREKFEQTTARLADNFDTLYDSAETVVKLRPTILQLAMQGKLVPQDPHDEPASMLLERIVKERESLIAVKKLKKPKPLPPIEDEEIPSTTPEGWVFCRLGEIIQISSGSFLPSHKMESEGTIPVFGGNGIAGYHDQYNVNQPTLVIGRVGFYCGSVHITPERAWVTDNAFITYFSESNIDLNFLYWLLTATNLAIRNNATAQPVISGTKVYPIVVGLPPLEEQKRVVAKVSQLMALCDEVETRLRQAEADSEKLMNAAVQHVLASISDPLKANFVEAIA